MKNVNVNRKYECYERQLGCAKCIIINFCIAYFFTLFGAMNLSVQVNAVECGMFECTSDSVQDDIFMQYFSPGMESRSFKLNNAGKSKRGNKDGKRAVGPYHQC